MNDKPTVFISYRQKVSGFAARSINDGLQALGLKVFFDADGIHLGDNWQAALEENLLESQFLIVILAPATLESEWVRKEVEFALRHGKSIIPIFTDGLANLYDVDFKQFPEQIAALRDIQGIEYNYKRPKPTFDELKIALNVSSPTTPAPLPVSPAPSTVKSSGKGLSLRGLISAGVIVLGLVFAFLALFPEQTRTDWFRSIGLLPTLTLVPSLTPTDTLIPPTDTAIPTLTAAPVDTATESVQLDITATAVLMSESTHLVETAHAVPTSTSVPSNTPKPSATPVPPSPTTIPSTPIPATATSLNGQLHIFATRESLTLYVTEPVSLLGFQFGVLVDGNLQLKSLKDSFDVLTLSGGQANANDCYVYVIDGESPPLSQSCKNGQVFRTTVAAADVFWYDAVANQPRNLAIFRDGQTTGSICSAAAPDCVIEWNVTTPILSTTVVILTSTPSTLLKQYPCPAQIILKEKIPLNVVHIRPIGDSSMADPVQQGAEITILAMEQESSTKFWYQISYQDNKQIGFIPITYVIPSSLCPN